MVPADWSEQTRRTFENFLNALPPSQHPTVYKAFQELLMSTVAANAIGIGDRAPAFSLPDVYGNQLHLASFLRHGPVVLSFYRGSWCPYCKRELNTLQRLLPEIRALGSTVIVLSPEKADASLRRVRELGLEFDVLTDCSSSIAEQFGLLMRVPDILRPLYLKWGVTLPAPDTEGSCRLPLSATYVIDTSGVVRMAHVDKDYTRRMEPEDIIEALRALYSPGDPDFSYLQ